MVVRYGAVPLLVQLLYSKDVHVCEQALWALANISGDGPECRDFVVSSGIIEPLLSFVKPNTPVGIPLIHPRSLSLSVVSTPPHFSHGPPLTLVLIHTFLTLLFVAILHTNSFLLSLSLMQILHLTLLCTLCTCIVLFSAACLPQKCGMDTVQLVP